MRILICHQYYNERGGEDSVFEDEVRYLKENGHDLETFVVRHNKNKLIQAVQFFLSCIGLSLQLKYLEKKINEFKPEIVRFHNVFPLISTKAFPIAKKSGAKTILVLHNYRPICINGIRFKNGKICDECQSKKSYMPGIINSCYRGSFFQSILASYSWFCSKLRNDFSSIDKFISLSKKSYSIYKNLEFTNSKLEILRNRISIRNVTHCQKKTIDFLFMGRLTEEKGIFTFLKIADQFQNYNFAIAGSGKAERKITDFIEKNKSGNLRYLGFLNKDKIESVMLASRALVVCSLWDEHCPMVILESYSFGVPVVSVDRGGHGELVSMLDSKLLFNDSDINTFSKVIPHLFSESNYNSLSIKAREIASLISGKWRYN